MSYFHLVCGMDISIISSWDTDHDRIRLIFIFSKQFPDLTGCTMALFWGLKCVVDFGVMVTVVSRHSEGVQHWWQTALPVDLAPCRSAVLQPGLHPCCTRTPAVSGISETQAGCLLESNRRSYISWTPGTALKSMTCAIRGRQDDNPGDLV